MEDIDLKSKTIQIHRSMEYRYSAKGMAWRTKVNQVITARYLNRRSGCYTKNKRKE